MDTCTRRKIRKYPWGRSMVAAIIIFAAHQGAVTPAAEFRTAVSTKTTCSAINAKGMMYRFQRRILQYVQTEIRNAENPSQNHILHRK